MAEITLPTDIKISKQEQDENEATIKIEGCYPGYGITLANSLRRVLLSSLKGAAVTNYSIEGIDHEFSTIPNVIEDAIQIGLNLKQLRFKTFEEKGGDEEYQLNLKVEGEKKVKAEEIQTPADIEIVNEDAHILTSTDEDTSLQMEINVATGLGLELSEDRKEEKLPIGTISVDSFYSPVRKVSYDIEEMRIGEKTNYNRIIMEIKTDGTITPSDAFQKAALILEEQFNYLQENKPEPEAEKEEAKEEEEEKKKEEEETEKDASEIDISDLKIPTRVANILQNNRIKTVAGLTQRKKETLSEIEGLGAKSIEEIEAELEKHGFALK